MLLAPPPPVSCPQQGTDMLRPPLLLWGAARGRAPAPRRGPGRRDQPAILGWRPSREKPEQSLRDGAERGPFQALLLREQGLISQTIIFPGPLSDQLKNNLSRLPTPSQGSASRFLLRQNPP